MCLKVDLFGRGGLQPPVDLINGEETVLYILPTAGAWGSSPRSGSQDVLGDTPLHSIQKLHWDQMCSFQSTISFEGDKSSTLHISVRQYVSFDIT